MNVYPMNVYVASSWRNARQPSVVNDLQANGFEVYDFRNPTSRPGVGGFHWSDIDPLWKSWTPEQFRAALKHPIAVAGFSMDYGALNAADACVLVMPCGRSAHLELGYCRGQSKRTGILLDDGEPELMYGLADCLAVNTIEIVHWLRSSA